MEFEKNKIIKYQGRDWKMVKQDGEMIILKCPKGCPRTLKVHKDQI